MVMATPFCFSSALNAGTSTSTICLYSRRDRRELLLEPGVHRHLLSRRPEIAAADPLPGVPTIWPIIQLMRS